MAEDKKSLYLVKAGSRVRHGGKLYEGNAEISLSDSEAESVQSHIVSKAEAVAIEKAKAAAAKGVEEK